MTERNEQDWYLKVCLELSNRPWKRFKFENLDNFCAQLFFISDFQTSGFGRLIKYNKSIRFHFIIFYSLYKIEKI